jgi:hypothetical protein
MHVPSSFIPHTPIAHKTTRTSYQLFFGDNPRPRAGSSAFHMARMKMEGHAGRFPSLSRHAWSHRPPMATFFQGVKNQPPATPNPPPSAFRTSSRLVPAAHRGCWCVVETGAETGADTHLYTPLVREMPPQAPRRPRIVLLTHPRESTSSGLVPAAHRGCWCVVETFQRRYTPLHTSGA